MILPFTDKLSQLVPRWSVLTLALHGADNFEPGVRLVWLHGTVLSGRVDSWVGLCLSISSRSSIPTNSPTGVRSACPQSPEI